MSVFGTIIDRSMNCLPDSGWTSPPMPGAGEDAGNIFRRTDVTPSVNSSESVDDALQTWENQALCVADQASGRASASPESVSALLRWAQAEVIAGREDMATAAASKALDLLLEREGQGFLAVAAIRILETSSSPEYAESYLRKFPQTDEIKLERARLATERGQYGEVLDLLTVSQLPRAHYYRGFAHIQLGNNAAAIREFRSARNSGVETAEVLGAMAYGYWRLGSQRKALSAALQASRLSPGRRDLSLMLMEFLFLAGKHSVLRNEISAVKARKVQETADFILIQARLAFAEGHTSRGHKLLRRVVTVAEAERDELLASEARGNCDILDWLAGKLSADQLTRRLRRLCETFPQSITLNILLADASQSLTIAPYLRENFISIQESGLAGVAELAPLAARIAYLECDFAGAQVAAVEWAKLHPMDPDAASAAIMMTGEILDDWSTAAALAVYAIKRLPLTPTLANNAAYAMAFGGRLREAEELLHEKWQDQYIIQATRGLLKLVDGDFDAGTALYRRAAELADRSKDGVESRALMACHQVMTFNRLGMMESVEKERLRALSLPSTPLPDDWERKPSFQLIRFMAEKHGWGWPLAVD